MTAFAFIIGFVIAIGIFAIFNRIYEYRSTHYVPSPETLCAQRALMELEKQHFGHYTLYYFRQTKEYKDWLKTVLLKGRR